MDCENSDSGSDMDLCSSEDEQSDMTENFLGDLPDLSSPTKTRVSKLCFISFCFLKMITPVMSENDSRSFQDFQ